jgi:uncharacterized iron-regulated protein
MADYEELWLLKDSLKADIKHSIMSEIEELARRQTADVSRVINEMLEQTAQRVLDEVNLDKVTGPVLENTVRNVLETQYAELVQQAVANAQYPKLIQKALAAATPEMKKAKEVFAQVVEEAVKEVIREAIVEALGETA